MIATAQVKNPETVELTLSVTMPVRDWRKVVDQLDTNQWPASDFGRVVRESISASVGRIERAQSEPATT